ncbi:MAG: GGDEF domain-containing protein, partial [Pygmaiobacter sp.]
SMSRDTFLRDYMREEPDGVQSPERIDTLKRYLAEYKNKNNFDSTFLVSVKTKNYYHYRNGLDQVMSPDNAEGYLVLRFFKLR